MKNIGIDCRFWGIKHAGLGRYARELVLSILKQNQNFNFTLFFQKNDYKQDEKLLKKCKIVELEMPHYSLKEQLLFGQIVDRQHLDFVHFMHFNVPMFLQTPFIVTIHDLIKHFFKGKPVTTRSLPVYWLKYGGYRLTIGNAIKKSNVIIVPSYFTKDQITLEYPQISEDKIRVIYEGVSHPYNSNSQLKTPDWKQIINKYKIDSPYFVYTGSAYPSKDLPTLLQALKKLNQNLDKNINAKLLIACARNIFWEKLKKMVHDLHLSSQVLLPGRVPDKDLICLYKHAQAFVMPSLMEGFGLPALEAMAAGCPIISSNAGSLPEIYGHIAFYFDAGNIKNLTEQMEIVLKISKEEREKIITKGIKYASQFSWDKAGTEVLSLYKKLSF